MRSNILFHMHNISRGGSLCRITEVIKEHKLFRASLVMYTGKAVFYDENHNPEIGLKFNTNKID